MSISPSQSYTKQKTRRECIVCPRKSSKIIYFSREIINANFTGVFVATITFKISFPNHKKDDQLIKAFYSKHFFCSVCKKEFEVHLSSAEKGLPRYTLVKRNSKDSSFSRNLKISPEVKLKTSFILEYQKPYQILANSDYLALHINFWNLDDLISMIREKGLITLDFLECIIMGKICYDNQNSKGIITRKNLEKIFLKIINKKVSYVDIEAFYFYLKGKVKDKEISLSSLINHFNQYKNEACSFSTFKKIK